MNHAITTLVEASETDLEGGAGNDDPDLRAQPDMNDDSNDTVASLPLDEYRIYNGRPSLSLPSVCSMKLYLRDTSLTEQEGITQYGQWIHLFRAV
jgi:hypothetical protein